MTIYVACNVVDEENGVNISVIAHTDVKKVVEAIKDNELTNHFVEIWEDGEKTFTVKRSEFFDCYMTNEEPTDREYLTSPWEYPAVKSLVEELKK